jgi:hypothetical protein
MVKSLGRYPNLERIKLDFKDKTNYHVTDRLMTIFFDNIYRMKKLKAIPFHLNKLDKAEVCQVIVSRLRKMSNFKKSMILGHLNENTIKAID